MVNLLSMLSSPSPVPAFRRAAFATLLERLREPRRFIQVIAGPRQVGKTTLVRQVVAELPVPARVASADDPGIRKRLARRAVGGRSDDDSDGNEPLRCPCDRRGSEDRGLAEAVKRLWDEDEASALGLRVVLLGSAPLLVEKGLSESLAGQFEMIRLSHWGYPGDARGVRLGSRPVRRLRRVSGGSTARRRCGALARLHPRLARGDDPLTPDILLLNRVDKPALLRQLFRLGCDYSGQVVSYQKLVGRIASAGTPRRSPTTCSSCGAPGCSPGSTSSRARGCARPELPATASRRAAPPSPVGPEAVA